MKRALLTRANMACCRLRTIGCVRPVNASLLSPLLCQTTTCRHHSTAALTASDAAQLRLVDLVVVEEEDNEEHHVYDDGTALSIGLFEQPQQQHQRLARSTKQEPICVTALEEATRRRVREQFERFMALEGQRTTAASGVSVSKRVAASVFLEPRDVPKENSSSSNGH